MTPADVQAVNERYIAITTAPEFMRLVAAIYELDVEIRALQNPVPRAALIIRFEDIAERKAKRARLAIQRDAFMRDLPSTVTYDAT